MVGECFNLRPPSWNQGLCTENIILPLKCLNNGNNLPAAEENIQTADFTSPLYSGNNLQASEGEISSHTAPHGLLSRLWYTPEELHYNANIFPESSTDFPHNALASTLDFAHGGNGFQDLRGESYTSIAPHTLVPELYSSPEEVQHDHEVPSAFNSSVPHDAFVTSPDTPHNDSDQTFMNSSDFSYSGSDPHTFKRSKRNLSFSSGQRQGYSNDPQAFDNSLPPEALVSPFDVRRCRDYLQNSDGHRSASDLYAYYKGLDGCREVMPAFDNRLPADALVSPLNVFQSQTYLQTSKGKSSTSMAPHTLSFHPSDSPEETQNSGSNPTVSNNGLRPNAFELGPDSLQSNVSFRGFGNDSPYTLFDRQGQVNPSEPSASHLNSPYSGHNLQTKDDAIYSSGPFHHGRSLPQQTNEFHTSTLDSDDGWQTGSNMTSTPPLHFYGHALTCIFSGNDFRSLIRVAESWPSASFLDISPKNGTSSSKPPPIALPITLSPQAYCLIPIPVRSISIQTLFALTDSSNLRIDPQATPAVKYGVMIPTPWKNPPSEGFRPANRSPLPPNAASIWRKDSNSIRAYSIVPGFDDRWVPHIEYEGPDRLPKRMVIGSPVGVSLILNGSLSFGAFTHRDMSANSAAAPSKIVYEETFLMAGVRLYGVAPRAEGGIV
ncbi:hypothetical protein MMC32_001650 [Xylographa parallela]|nr:hypothetical protein [Xylographa parallela]